MLFSKQNLFFPGWVEQHQVNWVFFLLPFFCLTFRPERLEKEYLDRRKMNCTLSERVREKVRERVCDKMSERVCERKNVRESKIVCERGWERLQKGVGRGAKGSPVWNGDWNREMIAKVKEMCKKSLREWIAALISDTFHWNEREREKERRRDGMKERALCGGGERERRCDDNRESIRWECERVWERHRKTERWGVMEKENCNDRDKEFFLI